MPGHHLPATGAVGPDLQVAAEHILAGAVDFHIDAQVAIDQHHIAQHAEFTPVILQAMVEVVAAGELVQVLGLVFLHGAGVDVTQIFSHQRFQRLEIAGEDGLCPLVVQRCDVGNGVSGGGGAHG